VGVLALWTAQSLCELGWLPVEGRARLPEVPERYAGRRATLESAAERLEWSRARRERLERALQPRLSSATLQGMQQIYGGLNLDGTLEPEFACVLPRGRELAVRLAPIEGRAELYPLEVRVYANERALGSLRVPAEGTGAATFALGPAEAGESFELRLEACDWTVVTTHGKSWVAGVRLVELESRP
jgi:hypothetical protein